MPLPLINIEGAKKCPSCGSEKRAGVEYVQELKKAGYLPKEYKVEDCFQLQTQFVMALHMPANIQGVIPILIQKYAICGECFTIYCTGLTSMAAKMAAMPRQGGDGGIPPPNFPQMKG